MWGFPFSTLNLLSEFRNYCPGVEGNLYTRYRVRFCECSCCRWGGSEDQTSSVGGSEFRSEFYPRSCFPSQHFSRGGRDGFPPASRFHKRIYTSSRCKCVWCCRCSGACREGAVRRKLLLGHNGDDRGLGSSARTSWQCGNESSCHPWLQLIYLHIRNYPQILFENLFPPFQISTSPYHQYFLFLNVIRLFLFSDQCLFLSYTSQIYCLY